MNGAATASARRIPSSRADEPRWYAFPGTSRHVAVARNYVEDHVADWPEDDRFNIGLCASEVVTNAVLHTRSGRRSGPDGGRFAVRVLRNGPLEVKVEVIDQGRRSKTPDLSLAGDDILVEDDETRVNGRGLDVVEELCEEWGYQATKTSRVTWFVYRWGGAYGTHP